MAREQEVNGCAEASSFCSQYAPIVMRAIDIASLPEPEAILATGGVRQVRSKAAGALEPQFYALR
jgi:hypothetical protein